MMDQLTLMEDVKLGAGREKNGQDTIVYASQTMNELLLTSVLPCVEETKEEKNTTVSASMAIKKIAKTSVSQFPTPAHLLTDSSVESAHALLGTRRTNKEHAFKSANLAILEIIWGSVL